jgi:CRP-like cAMP-binding protein
MEANPATRSASAMHGRMTAASNPQDNCVLASLEPGEFFRISEQLQLVRLSVGQVLIQQSAKVRFIHFPTTAVLSMQHILEDGFLSEIAGIGREGLCGACALLDGSTISSQVVVQSGGEAFRVPVCRLATEFERGGAFSSAVLRYVQMLFLQVTQTTTCNSRHPIEKRLCKWLLLALDRNDTDELIVTQERLGQILGVRREGVTEAAGRLQSLGAISYGRGRLTIVDRSKIASLACECYAVLRGLHDNLLLL